MGDVDVDCEVSGPGATASIRIRVLLRCMGSDVRETVRLNNSITVRHG